MILHLKILCSPVNCICILGPGWGGRPGPFGLLESAYMNQLVYMNHNVFLLLWPAILQILSCSWGAVRVLAHSEKGCAIVAGDLLFVEDFAEVESPVHQKITEYEERRSDKSHPHSALGSISVNVGPASSRHHECCSHIHGPVQYQAHLVT